jgi:hypothetical protein
MKPDGWDTLILSEPDYEHLVAELHFNGQFLLLMDREEGREKLYVSIKGHLGEQVRIPLDEFMQQLKSTAENLCR